MNTRGLLLAAVLALLIISPFATAISIGTGVKFETRSGTTIWTVGTPLTVDVLQVTATTVVLDGYAYDFERTTGNLNVTITQIGNDRKSFDLLTPTVDVVTFRMTNPGLDWTLYVDNAALPLGHCASTTSQCVWTVPAGTQLVSAREGATPGGGGGGGGGDATSSGGTDGGDATPIFKDPFALFPQFSVAQWATFLAGFVFVLNGFPRTRGVLPAPFRIPAPADVTRLVGFVMLALLYISA